MKATNLLLIIAVIGAIMFFGGNEKKTEDSSVGLAVLVYDSAGRLVKTIEPGKKESLVTFPGQPQTQQDQIAIRSTMTNDAGGNVNVVIRGVTGTNNGTIDVYKDALSNYVLPSPEVPPGQQYTQTSDLMPVSNLEVGNVLFTLDVDAYYYDAEGFEKSADAIGQVLINIIADNCSDGTMSGVCADYSRGMYCDDGALIPGATTYLCGCCMANETDPCGWDVSEDSCTRSDCEGGYTDGQCFDVGTYFPKQCVSGEIRNACNACENGGTTCRNDYYENPVIPGSECSSVTDPATCNYQIYGAQISVVLGEPQPTHLECINNACTEVIGDSADLDGCTTVGEGCNLLSVVFRTNNNLDYRGSSFWIAVECDGNLEGYGYYAYTSYNCLLENTFVTTSEDYPICTRPGYLCSSRVYLDNGPYGVIYKPDYGASYSAILDPSPCCGTTCGDCCERYSDGTTYCS